MRAIKGSWASWNSNKLLPPCDTRARFWYSRRGNEDLSVLPQTARSQVGQQTPVEVSKLVCQIIEIHQWESEKLGESRPTDCNDPVYRGRGDLPRWYFQQQDLMEGLEREKGTKRCSLAPCTFSAWSLILTGSTERETKILDRIVVSCGIDLTKIKRVLSASRCGRDGRRYQYMCSSNRFELRHFKRIRISCGSMISPQSHTKRISRTETPSHPELIPSVLPRGEPVFREIMWV